jgi:SAM-dependent methyltransferase
MPIPPSQISFRRSEEAWDGFEAFLKNLIETRGVRTICDIGGGANPVLPIEYIQERSLDYTVLDIAESELQKAPASYHKIAADIASRDCVLGGRSFDLVFSKMLAEHISNAPQFHTNIRKILAPGGVAAHFFPTLYAFPFAVNRIISESLSDRLLGVIAPRDRYRHAKFPAYYQWCRGPTRRQFQRLASVGLGVVEYIGFFGHAGYYRRLPGIKQIHELTTRMLLKFPNPHLTSYAYLVVTPMSRDNSD